MNLLLGLIAQLLHIALMAAAAPTLLGAIDWMKARLAGRSGAAVLQPWRDLLRLSRKQTMMAESASDVTGIAPLVAVAATAVAACLVPSFALGMTFARFDDMLVIVGLLGLARCALAFSALDAGTAAGGMGASRTLLLACLADTALLLVVFVAGMLVAGTNLAAAVVALAAALPIALVDAASPEPMEAEASGTDLALIRIAAALRLLVWFDLLGALFLPWSMARPGAGLIAWLIGLACWLGRTMVFAAAVALAQMAIGRLRLLRAAQMLGVSVFLGLLAAALLFADMRAA